MTLLSMFVHMSIEQVELLEQVCSLFLLIMLHSGCKGSVYTYVRNDQVYHFKQMIKPLHTRSITYTNIKNEEDVEKVFRKLYDAIP